MLSSCGESCVAPYDFGSQTITLKANREGFVDGAYPYQVAEPYGAGFFTNGDPLVIGIRGEWSAWQEINTQDLLHKAPICDLSFKKDGTQNRICNIGEDPEKTEFDLKRYPISLENHDCSQPDQQNDPNYCTCTKQYGSIYDLENYSLSTNHQNINETIKVPDDQRVCKYNAGMGAYIGLYGMSGYEDPKRLYHMYTTETRCDVARNRDGECVVEGENGKKYDATTYIYRSPNNKIFVKDDKSGNNGTDTNFSDDEYHSAGERIKVNIYDTYYNDNYGSYTLIFLSGIIMGDDPKLIGYIVKSIEDIFLGPIKGEGDDAKRGGGILERMYNVIVKDSTFIAIVQIALILYVTFFGMGILMGSVEISTKEISSRVIKIALILFFTSSTSWYWYNQIIVGFFQYGLDSVIALFSNIVRDIIVKDGSLLEFFVFSESLTNADKFKEADEYILKFIALPTHRKIWSLLFSSPFGLIYIFCLYAIIIFFIYVVVSAALLYVTNLLQLLFVLALGPLFILASLFSKTESMFKQWLAFMAARSLEILVLFLFIYVFLALFFQRMVELFYFEACPFILNLGFTNFDILKPTEDRSLVEWMTQLLEVAALLFLFKILLDKVTSLVTDLVSVSGASVMDSGAVGFAGGLAGTLAGGVKSALTGAGKFAYRKANNGLNFASRASGATEMVLKARRFLPIRGLASRNIDNAIEEATENAKAQGLSGAGLNENVRSQVTSKMSKDYNQKGKTFNGSLINERLNKSLVEKPMEEFINQRAKQLRSDHNRNLTPSQFKDQLRKDTLAWGKKNLGISEKDINKAIDSTKSSSWYKPYVMQTLMQKKALDDASYVSQKSMAERLSDDKGWVSRQRAKLTRRGVSGRNVDAGSFEAQKQYIDELLLSNPNFSQRSFMDAALKNKATRKMKFGRKTNLDSGLLGDFVKNLDENSRSKIKEYLSGDDFLSSKHQKELIKKAQERYQQGLKDNGHIGGIMPEAGARSKGDLIKEYREGINNISGALKLSQKEKEYEIKELNKAARDSYEELNKEARDSYSKITEAQNLKEVKGSGNYDALIYENLNLTDIKKEHKATIDLLNEAAKDPNITLDTSKILALQSDVAVEKSKAAVAKVKKMQLQMKLLKTLDDGEKRNVEIELASATKDMDDARSKLSNLENELLNAKQGT